MSRNKESNKKQRGMAQQSFLQHSGNPRSDGKLEFRTTPRYPPIVLEVKELGRYLNNQWYWRNLNIKVIAGAQVGIIGPSGSGKSLLLRSLAGLDEIQEGSIRFQEKLLEEWHMPFFRSRVIYLAQRPSLIEGSVEENLRYIFRFSVHEKIQYDAELITHYLALLGKELDFLNRQTSELSGGEAQIVVFLRALQLHPQILLFDESTASLDEASVQVFENLIKTWQSEAQDRAYFWTGHSTQQVERMTNQHIYLE